MRNLALTQSDSSAPLHDGRYVPLESRDWFVLTLIVLFATVIKIAMASQRGFWLDEYYTLQAAQLSPQLLIENRLVAGHSPLPFFYAKLFHDQIGWSVRALRLSSILAFAASVFGIAGLTLQLGLRRALWPAVVLAAFSPYWHEIGTEFRYMMPLTAVCTFWLWALVAFCQRATLTRWFTVYILGTIALWIHGSAQFFGVGVLFAAGAMAWYTRQTASRPWLRGLILISPVLAAFASSLPLVFLLKSAGNGGNGIPSAPAFKNVLRNLASTYFSLGKVAESATGLNARAFVYMYLATFLAAVYGSIHLARRERFHNFAALALGVLVMGPISMIIYSVLVDSVQNTLRYIAPASILVILVLAFGWVESAKWGRKGIFWRAALVVLGSFAFAMELINQGHWHRESEAWLASIRRSDEPVILIGRDTNLIAFRYLGFPEEGSISGVQSGISDHEEIAELIRPMLEGADSAFLFQYRGHRNAVDIALKELVAEELVTAKRAWNPTRQMRIIALAMTPAGVERIGAISPMPMPTFTDDPL